MKVSHHPLPKTKRNMYNKYWVAFCTTRAQLTWLSCMPSLQLHQNRPTLQSVHWNEYNNYYITCTLIQQQSFIFIHQIWHWMCTQTLATCPQEKDKVTREVNSSLEACRKIVNQSKLKVTLPLHVQYVKFAWRLMWWTLNARCEPAPVRYEGLPREFPTKSPTGPPEMDRGGFQYTGSFPVQYSTVW